MNVLETMYQLKHLREVKHTTLDPRGPGVVRIHLIPPRFGKMKSPSVVILNGKDILPLNPAWANMLSEFIDQINMRSGRTLTEMDFREIKMATLEKMKKIYFKTKHETLRQDLEYIFEVILDVAYGRIPNATIPYMSIGEYAEVMNAPHRMDLMISSMTKNGCWHCNQRCTNCYAAGQHQADVEELSTDEWKRVIDKCRKAFIPQITFTGGEPTLRNDLVELVEYSQWFVTRLNTNGILLSKGLCENLYEASLDSVQVTLYSSVKEEHELLTGVNAFEKTVQGIKNALETGLNVSINTPLCRINKNYVETLRFLQGLGIKYVSCSGIIYTGNARNEEAKKEQMTSEELYDVLKKAKEFCDANDMEISFTSPGQVSEKELRSIGMQIPTCGACMSNMAIAPNGDVAPCQSWLDVNGYLGNILKDSWKRIWNAPLAMRTRKFAANVDPLCPLRQRL